MAFLIEYQDKEGLTSTRFITMKNNQMFINGVEIMERYELNTIIKDIKENQYLWKNLKFKVEKKKKVSRSSAPIVNIPFDKAIDLIISGKRNLSPRFRIDVEYSKDAIFGILLANFKKEKHLIHFQLWQIYHIDKNNINIPTNYIHGIFDTEKDCFVHFDGALIHHDKIARQQIEDGIIPEKNFPYLKLFRLDCEIEKNIAKNMMSKYLPVEELNREFGLNISNITTNPNKKT